LACKRIFARSRSDKKKKTGSRSIRIAFSIAIVIAFENKKSKSARNFSIEVCPKKINQGPVVKS